MHREMGQPSLVESLLPQTLGRNERLERIDTMIDWERLGQLVSRVYSAREGRPSYPPVMMVKALLIQQGNQLDELGLVLKEGTLVEAQVRRPPVSAGRGAKSATGPDADWTRSQGGVVRGGCRIGSVVATSR